MTQVFGELLTITPDLLMRFLIAMAVAILLSFGIGMVYRYTHRGLSYEATFLPTIVVMAPVVCCVMFFIQGNLVLSLGLVGSLSIIRFRTPVKDSRDMVFLFWSITVGLGAGTNNLGLVVVASLMVALLFIVLHLIRYGIPTNAEYVLIITGDNQYPAQTVEAVLGNFQIEAYLRSHEVRSERWERVVELKFNKIQPEIINLLVQELSEVEDICEVSVLAPQLALPM